MDMKFRRPELLPKGEPGIPGKPGEDGMSCDCDYETLNVEQREQTYSVGNGTMLMAWTYARNVCKGRNMQLATAYNADQWSSLKEEITAAGLNNQDVWLGAAKRGDVGNLIWFDYALPINPSVIGFTSHQTASCTSAWCCMAIKNGNVGVRNCLTFRARHICSVSV